MSTPRPCALLWLAQDYEDGKQHEAYMRVVNSVPHPEGRSTVVVVDEDERLAIDDLLSNFSFFDHFDRSVLDAAKKRGFGTAKFGLMMYFRHVEEAPSIGPDIPPLSCIGRFEFPFPERGDFIRRDEHEWLGIDSEFCSDPEPDGDYIGRSDTEEQSTAEEPIPPPASAPKRLPEVGIVVKLRGIFGRRKDG